MNAGKEWRERGDFQRCVCVDGHRPGICRFIFLDFADSMWRREKFLGFESILLNDTLSFLVSASV